MLIFFIIPYILQYIVPYIILIPFLFHILILIFYTEKPSEALGSSAGCRGQAPAHHDQTLNVCTRARRTTNPHTFQSVVNSRSPLGETAGRMARNQEKAHGMFNKWTSLREGRLTNKPKSRYIGRPSDCNDLHEAEQNRRELMHRMHGKVEEIQNAGLGEHIIRELNDSINDMLRNKRRWEKRIIELGGPNYIRLAPKVFDADGRELPGDGGYKYFGAARNLPIVQRLFRKRKRGESRRSKAEIMKKIKPNYFSLGGREDDALLRSEAACEASATARREAGLELGAQGDGGFEKVIAAVESAKNILLSDVTASHETEPLREPDPEADLEAMRASLLAKLNST